MKAESKRSKEIQETLKAIEENLKTLDGEIAVIKRNQADLGSRMFTMAGGEISGFSGKLDEVKHNLETTNAKLDDFKAALLQRISSLEESAASKAAPAPKAAVEAGKEGQAAEAVKPAETTAAPQSSDPTQLYQSSYLDYTKGNYEVAITGFREYQKSFPDGEFVGNAQYWIGESLYSLGKYEEALAEFDKVVKTYPDSQKVPGAMLKQGFCYDALKKPAEAREAFELVMKKFPDSEAAKLAAEKLKPKVRGKVPGK
jgi:tol-pal system protein YbgF